MPGEPRIRDDVTEGSRMALSKGPFERALQDDLDLDLQGFRGRTLIGDG